MATNQAVIQFYDEVKKLTEQYDLYAKINAFDYVRKPDDNKAREAALRHLAMQEAANKVMDIFGKFAHAIQHQAIQNHKEETQPFFDSLKQDVARLDFIESRERITFSREVDAVAVNTFTTGTSSMVCRNPNIREAIDLMRELLEEQESLETNETI